MTEFQFIPHHKWLWYICEGWMVESWSHHERHGLWASRRAR